MVQGSILFFNVDHVRSELERLATSHPDETRWFLLDASAVAQVDSTAAEMLKLLREALAARGIAFGVAELHRDPRDLLKRSGLLGEIGPALVFEDIEEGLTSFEDHQRKVSQIQFRAKSRS